MKFPNSLLYKGRRIYPSNFILSFNYMFVRCPHSEWKEGDDFPDFNQIKLNHSFNWSVFSIPLWAKFNDKKEYRDNYGVIGYKVATIRNTHKINPRFDPKILDINHKPIEFNYSHCELFPNRIIEKKDKREIRMTFKHKCIRPIFPSSKRTRFYQVADFLRMYSHRFILRCYISMMFRHNII